jgi:hypothetical protein
VVGGQTVTVGQVPAGGVGVVAAPKPITAPVPVPAPASKNIQHDEDDDDEEHGASGITKRHDGKDGKEHKDGNGNSSSQSQPQKGGKPQFSGAEKMMSARGIAGILLGSAAVIAFSMF